MGSRYSVYIGPYAKCVNTCATVTVQRKTCTNTKCKAHGDHRNDGFCPKCGSEVKNIDIKREGWKVDIGDLYEELEDRLHTLGSDYGEVDLWVANVSNGRCFDNDVGELRASADRDKETESFKTKYAEDIATLIENYGEAHVQIKWGVIGDWS